METSLAPLDKVRREFKRGRPIKKLADARPLAAVAYAQEQVARLKTALLEVGLDNPRCEVALVLGNSDVFPIPDSDVEAANVGAKIAAQKSQPIGLIFSVVNGMDFEYWTKNFLGNRTVEKVLDIAVARQISELQKRQDEAQ